MFTYRRQKRNGARRFLTVYKPETMNNIQADAPSSRELVHTLLNKFPVTHTERQGLLPLTEGHQMVNPKGKVIMASATRLCMGCLQVPPAAVNPELLPFRKALPIWSMRDDIVNSINSNKVVLISGDTGSGKTTQIPQFILEHCASVKKECRIICTQPNSISAVTVSTRVATERNEEVGQAVGYDLIREIRASPRTVLMYCTYAMLLQALMEGDSTLNAVTHIVVDDIQERNRFSDLLLIALRDSVAKFPLLHLILISATVNLPMLATYFNNCPIFVASAMPVPSELKGIRKGQNIPVLR